MDEKREDKITAFDTLFSTHHLQMCKLLLPYTDAAFQKKLAVYIKYMELQYTISFVKKRPYPVCSIFKQESSPGISSLCEELSPFCTNTEKERLSQIQQMLHTMEMYQDMAGAMDMFKDVMPEMDGNGTLSPDMLSQMMELFGGMGFGQS